MNCCRRGIFPNAQNRVSSVLRPTIYRKDGRFFALVAVRDELSSQAYTIHLAQDRSVDEEFTGNFGLLVVLVLAVGSVASAAIAITLTRRGLRPLAEITRSLERMGPSICTSGLSRPLGRANYSRSRSRSMKCSIGWRIPSPACPNSPPISRMNSGHQSPISVAKPRSPCGGHARRRSTEK